MEADLFRHFFWLIFPIMGMMFGAFAVWNEYSRQKKALEVLKAYAEKGQEPPASVLAVLNRASTPANRRAPLPRATFFAVLGAGFLIVAIGFAVFLSPRFSWVFVAGFGITAFVMMAIALSSLVEALTSKNDQ